MLVFGVVGVAALSFWAYVGFILTTVEVPKSGGVYTEAIFGRPTYFNPLLLRAGINGEAEASVVALVYSGLFRTDGDGVVIPDIAQRYDVSDDGKTYTIYLNQDVLWHDGENVTVDDVIYTFNTIQDPRFTIAPALADAWKGIAVERVDDFTVKFILEKAFVPFVGAQLRTGIMPEHIWGSVEPDGFSLSTNNVRPIGSGPYKMQEVLADTSGVMSSVILSRFRDYHLRPAYIDRITLSFFDTEENVLNAYKTHKAMGVSLSAHDIDSIVDEGNVQNPIQTLSIPSGFGVFFNPLKSAALAYNDVRKALALAIDRTDIVERVLGGHGAVLVEPFVKGMVWHTGTDAWPKYDTEAAKALLEKEGWKAGDDGIRAREGTVLRFSITVPDWDDLVATANILKEQWREIGVDVQVNIKSMSEFNNAVSKREYGALLYAQTYFSFDADPLPFWHSSQKTSPGHNYSQLTNKDIDKVLIDAQSEQDEDKRKAYYNDFAEKLAKHVPAVFLYAPQYFYAQSYRVKGFDSRQINRPSERFATVTDWYVATKRAFVQKNE